MFANFEPGGSVFIQGGSRGIGLAFVEAALAEPRVGRVYASCRRPQRAEALRALSDAHPERLRPLALDLQDEATIAAAAERIGEDGDRLHLLINVAGLLHDDAMRPEKRLADVDADALRRGFVVNAFGPLLVAKHCQRFFRHRDRAVLASLSARVGSITDNALGGWYTYRAAKAAQNMFTKTLSIEFARREKTTICVALHPGTVATELSKPFQGGVSDDKLFSTERAARQLLGVIDSLQQSDSGGFFAWDGRPIPW